ncbi:HAD-superfamily hydrolase, subfamily IIB [Thalassoporum mexicanum PCC 7367]|uniref:HAD-IIB family hydrolase n=1 Tax=Thalassoporum mexicanum TaxID=3457544 RepID=UPI00029FD0C5|nr:HAD-IIB family hydrolase [Pseudanabaena sp. PCC 7367]AFY69258.1 HAD-superfamily hydrolase, subfamily IIB [Pseudanabaena sp. PCC 7367]
MSLLPLPSADFLSSQHPGQISQPLAAVKLIASDVDGTLTRGGKFTAELPAALDRLTNKGIAVLLVTGRSAGWVSALRNYFPVAGAIAENGGLFFASADQLPQVLSPIGDLVAHRQKLASTFTELCQRFPQLQESVDNAYRITDWTFDVAGLSDRNLSDINQICTEAGWGFTYSTVQCHIKPIAQDKATGILAIISQHFAHLTTQQILTIGDSPNDEAMFDRQKFPLSVGVANLREYSDRLTHQPTYITSQPEVAGFGELVDLLVSL